MASTSWGAESSLGRAISAGAVADGAARTLENLSFDNLQLRALPVDESLNAQPRPVPGACFALVKSTPCDNPQLVCASPEALALLDIAPSEIVRPDFAAYFSGNRLLPGTRPAAHCYCGHQFGHFSGQLGDGATMYLGEVVNRHGERWELQFKGAGKTPFSRTADGRKVLRSSIREFLASEAMFYLGVPTTRSGSCVTSDSRVVRDLLYDGNAILERATVITRIAPSFLRFGSFEICRPTDTFTGRAGPSAGRDAEILPSLLHHAISTIYPDIWAAHDGDALCVELAAAGGWEVGSALPGGLRAKLHALYLQWFGEVVRRTASLVAGWQGVGWCHGVLNTDNMSIAGLTLDYGPYGFMDRYDPDYVANGSDDQGRYDVKGQPAICRWNCEKLAESLRALLPEAQAKRVVAEVYEVEFERCYSALLRAKLGLRGPVEAGDAGLGQGLLDAMQAAGADYTNTWRALSRVSMPAPGQALGEWSEAAPQQDFLAALLDQCASPADLAEACSPRIPKANLKALSMLALKDPQLLHQLGLTPQALQAELAREKRSDAILAQSPAAKAAEDRKRFAEWLRGYGARLQRDAQAGASGAQRVESMNATNPKFILRNWIAQTAIEKAEKGEYSEVARVLDLLRQPYAEAPILTSSSPASAADAAAPAAETAAAAAAGDGGVALATGVSCSVAQAYYGAKPPAWASKLVVT